MITFWSLHTDLAGCAWSWGGNPEGQMEFGSHGPVHFLVFHSRFSKGVLEEDGGLKVVYSCETESATYIIYFVVCCGGRLAVD